MLSLTIHSKTGAGTAHVISKLLKNSTAGNFIIIHNEKVWFLLIFEAFYNFTENEMHLYLEQMYCYLFNTASFYSIGKCDEYCLRVVLFILFPLLLVATDINL